MALVKSIRAKLFVTVVTITSALAILVLIQSVRLNMGKSRFDQGASFIRSVDQQLLESNKQLNSWLTKSLVSSLSTQVNWRQGDQVKEDIIKALDSLKQNSQDLNPEVLPFFKQ